jgi:sulfoxide reductase heme-binding subunit YedZ
VSTTSRTNSGITWFQASIHFLGWLPLVWIYYDFSARFLSVNPIQELEQRLGRIAVYFLIASLACTPIHTLFGWREPLKRRRALGLYCFLYACLHVLAFTGLDYGFNMQWIGEIILRKPFAILGLVTFILLLPLAITSFRWWAHRLGRKWTHLHRLVYLAGVFDILHFIWARKGNLFTLSGNILWPVLWGLVLLLLLFLRLAPVRRWVGGWRYKFAHRT